MVRWKEVRAVETRILGFPELDASFLRARTAHFRAFRAQFFAIFGAREQPSRRFFARNSRNFAKIRRKIAKNAEILGP